jgi:hypothetical protein
MTQTIETTPAGVVQLSEPCWDLVYANNGEEWDDGDDSPHFADKDEVDAFVANLDGDERPALRARQLDRCCWTATAVCGLPFEDEGGAWLHWTTVEEALREARKYDWSVRDGVLRCEDGDDCQPVAPQEGL